MTVKATFKNGVFLPDEPVDVPEGTQALIELIRPSNGDKPWMKLAGTLSDEEAKKMMADIDEAFGQVNLDEWR